jgi:spire-like protein
MSKANTSTSAGEGHTQLLSPGRTPRGGGLNGKTPRTELDDRGCLVVANIVESFGTPISEEHAWALCYQAAKAGIGILGNESQKEACLLVTSMAHLVVHKDGQVTPATFLDLQEHGKGKFSLHYTTRMYYVLCYAQCSLVVKYLVLAARRAYKLCN